MAQDNLYSLLSRRESQIMDIVFTLGEATAVEIQSRLPDAPSNSTVRNILRTMEERGYLFHYIQKGQFFYRPVIEKESAGISALRHVLTTFFGGSIPRIVSMLLTDSRLNPTDIAKLERLIEEARKDDE